MIQIKYTKQSNGSLLVALDGHASEAEGEKEAVQVCATVSSLFVTLADVCGVPQAPMNIAAKKALSVSPKNSAYLDFFRRGILLLDENYPGHIEVTEED
jgi:uncharacterized protein YsxB (DUF464 family)